MVQQLSSVSMFYAFGAAIVGRCNVLLVDCYRTIWMLPLIGYTHWGMVDLVFYQRSLVASVILCIHRGVTFDDPFVLSCGISRTFICDVSFSLALQRVPVYIKVMYLLPLLYISVLCRCSHQSTLEWPANHLTLCVVSTYHLRYDQLTIWRLTTAIVYFCAVSLFTSINSWMTS